MVANDDPVFDYRTEHKENLSPRGKVCLQSRFKWQWWNHAIPVFAKVDANSDTMLEDAQLPQFDLHLVVFVEFSIST